MSKPKKTAKLKSGPQKTWKKGDMCTVTVGDEGNIAFRIREPPSRAYPESAYLERVDGQDGSRGHGRVSLHNLSPMELDELRLVTTATRRRR